MIFDPVEVINGQIIMTLDGERRPTKPHQAWWTYLQNHVSTNENNRRYAADIRSALDKIGYLR